MVSVQHKCPILLLLMSFSLNIEEIPITFDPSHQSDPQKNGNRFRNTRIILEGIKDIQYVEAQASLSGYALEPVLEIKHFIMNEILIIDRGVAIFFVSLL